MAVQPRMFIVHTQPSLVSWALVFVLSLHSAEFAAGLPQTLAAHSSPKFPSPPPPNKQWVYPQNSEDFTTWEVLVSFSLSPGLSAFLTLLPLGPTVLSLLPCHCHGPHADAGNGDDRSIAFIESVIWEPYYPLSQTLTRWLTFCLTFSMLVCCCLPAGPLCNCVIATN